MMGILNQHFQFPNSEIKQNNEWLEIFQLKLRIKLLIPGTPIPYSITMEANYLRLAAVRNTFIPTRSTEMLSKCKFNVRRF
jgi:hypothetical protein